MKVIALTILVASGLMSSIAGCGSEPAPMGVSGVVTLDGRPIESGRIVLEPASSKGQRRNAKISNGAFALATEEGVLPGEEFKVVIQAFKKTGKKFAGPDPTVAYEEEIQYLPEKYDSASTVRVKISPDERENQLKFELTSR